MKRLQWGGLDLPVSRILLLSPHADDETIGAGGLLALAAAERMAVKVVVLATPHNSHRELELSRAMRELGIADFSVMHRGLECRLQEIPIMDLIIEIDRLQSEFKPDLMLVSATSHHQDHELLFKAAFAAARQSLNPDKFFTRIVALYEYPPLQWATEPFEPNWWVDISRVIQKKVRAFSAYESQTYPRGWANGDGIRAYAKSIGTFVNMDYAEKFRILRILSHGRPGA